MLLLCECCHKPIERLDEIKLVHKNGCEIVPVIEPEPIPEVEEPLDRPSVQYFPDGRMTPENAAKYTGFTAGTLSVLRCRGGGPKFVKRGHRVFYFQGDLDAWLNENGGCVSTAMARFKGTTNA